MKLSLVISSLGAGGAERVLTTIAAGLAARGHEVVLTTLSGGDDFFDAGPGVRRVSLGVMGPSAHRRQAVVRAWATVTALRRALLAEGPDVVLSFVDRTNVAVLLAVATKLPVVVSERTDPRRHDPGAWWSRLRRLAYRRAAVVVVQSEAFRPWAEAMRPRRVAVVPNPVTPVPSEEVVPADVASTLPYVVAVGRLGFEKGFDQLVEAFGDVVLPRRPDLSLVIAGDGPERDRLARLIASRGLGARVHLIGRRPEVGALVAAARLLALPSRFEGFPNVVLEAMARRVPVVAFACPGGVTDVVVDGVSGVLVAEGDVQALGTAIVSVDGDDERRLALAAGGAAVAAAHEADRIIDQWLEILEAATA